MNFSKKVTIAIVAAHVVFAVAALGGIYAAYVTGHLSMPFVAGLGVFAILGSILSAVVLTTEPVGAEYDAYVVRGKDGREYVVPSENVGISFRLFR